MRGANTVNGNIMEVVTDQIIFKRIRQMHLRRDEKFRGCLNNTDQMLSEGILGRGKMATQTNQWCLGVE